MNMDHNFDENQQFLPITMVRQNHMPILLFAVFGTVAWICVALRTYTRARVLRKFGWDDATMILSVMLFTVYCTGFMMVHLIVVGKKSLTVRQWKRSLVWLLVAEQFYTITITVLKISLAIFFHRAVVRKWHKWVIYVTVTTSTIFGFAYFFFSLLQCGMFTDIMEFGMKKLVDQCVSPMTALGMGYGGSLVATVTDFIFAALPILVLKHTRMERREKITVFFILAFAATGSIASLVRIRYISIFGVPNMDFYSKARGLGTWSLIELALGIIAGSLATLRPLFRKVLTPVRSIRLPQALRKSRDSNDVRSPSIRKSRISGPLMANHSNGGGKHFGATDTAQTVLWLKVDWDQISGGSSPSAYSQEWDRATLIEMGDQQWAKDELGVLSPLPRITPYRGRGERDMLRHVEMTPMRVKPDRRSSFPG